MKIEVSKEWCLNMAKLEEGCEVGAGAMDRAWTADLWDAIDAYSAKCAQGSSGEGRIQAAAAVEAVVHRVEEGLYVGAVRDIDLERKRQIESEGWSPAHDDAHIKGELTAAAYSYLWAHMPFAPRPASTPPTYWPWERSWWKPKSARADLVRASALIVAEIERLDRQAYKDEQIAIAADLAAAQR